MKSCLILGVVVLLHAMGFRTDFASAQVPAQDGPLCPSTTAPWNEGFESPLFPPDCWTLNIGSANWVRSSAASGFGTGGFSAMADFYNITGNIPFALITFPFTISALPGARLSFDYAYATYDTQVDQLDVFASTNSGSSYTLLAAMPGGLNGILNTGGASTSLFVPTSAQWATYSIALPPGTNMIAFNATSAYGNNLYLDNIRVTATSVHDVGVLSIDVPSETINAGTTVTPQVTVSNTGTYTESFTVSCETTDGYTSNRLVTGLLPGNSQQLTFDAWTPAIGEYTLTVCSELPGDIDSSNDCKTKATGVYSATWSAGASIPASVYAGAGATYTNTAVPPVSFLYCLGGITHSGLGTECYKLNLSTNTWSTIASLPEGRNGHAAICSGDYIYVIGGSNVSGTPQRKVYRYSISGNSWTTVAQLPAAVTNGKAVAYGTNYLYLAGGTGTGGSYLSTVYLYNIASNSWSTATAMPAARYSGAFAITGNTLIYIGGGTSSGISNAVYTGTINSGNPLSISWALKSPYPGITIPPNELPDPETGQGTVSRENDPDASPYPPGSMFRFEGATWGPDGIIVAGGSNTTDWTAASPSLCYRYLPASDLWMKQPNLPVATTAYQGGSVSDASGTWRFIIAGGLNESGSGILPSRILSDTPVTPSRTLNLTFFLEGLYAGNGSMNPAADALGPHWGSTIADHVTIDLINTSTGAVVYTLSDVPLALTGSCSLTIPWQHNGSYYLYLRHRNSITTASAVPLSFNNSTANYTFDQTSKAYGNNLKTLTNSRVALFSGDVNQDGAVDQNDMNSIYTMVSLFQIGYISQDVNGDGITDAVDFEITDNNGRLFVHSILPF